MIPVCMPLDTGKLIMDTGSDGIQRDSNYLVLWEEKQFAKTQASAGVLAAYRYSRHIYYI